MVNIFCDEKIASDIGFLFTIDKWKKLAYNKQSKDGGRSRAKREFVEIPVPQPC